MTYKIKGLCEESKHDRKYTLEVGEDRKPYFKGLFTSIITWVN